MPSTALTVHFEHVIADAEDLDLARSRLSRRYRRAAAEPFSRAMVVMCVAAWEAYVEELVRLAVDALRPAAGPVGVWPALNAAARSALGRFNNPSPDQVRQLLSDTLCLADVPNAWRWRGCPAAQARTRLEDVMRLRHQIAHGVSPRPPVLVAAAGRLPAFFRRLAGCTDAAVRRHLTAALGVPEPWPE